MSNVLKSKTRMRHFLILTCVALRVGAGSHADADDQLFIALQAMGAT